MATRRQFLFGGLAAGALLMAPGKVLAALPSRDLGFMNTHTGEKLRLTYWEKGSYLPDALAEINHVLRDHRTGEAAPIDPELLDALAVLRRRLDTQESLHVISGYRSPKTNAALAARSGGVAKRSLHMLGKAIDIRVPGRSIADLTKAAKSLQAGGVGRYDRSQFVHLDTGRVRYW